MRPLFRQRTLAIAALALGGVSLITVLLVAAPAAAAPQEKVVVCHAPPGNPENAHTIVIGAPAAEAHLANHPDDSLGACGDDDGGGGA